MSSPKELFQEAYDNCEAEDIKDFNTESFIEYCEAFYKMSSKEFQTWFEKNNFEGNVDQQLWYSFIKNQ